jgi:segregation and condensation protein A
MGQLHLFPGTPAPEPSGEAEEVSPRGFYQVGPNLPEEFQAGSLDLVEDPGSQPSPRSQDPDAPYWAEMLEEEAEYRGDRGLSLLVDLVQSGAVDPWDVDLEVVADRFMAAVDALVAADLPRSGRLLFFASVLIRMKAQFLAGRGQDLLGIPEENLEEGWDDGAIDFGEFEGLDDEDFPRLSRRGPGENLLLPRQRIQKRRPITIQDLLEALESSEEHERKKEQARQRRQGRRANVPFASVKEAMDTLHKDDLVRDIEQVSGLVTLAFQSLGKIAFSSLIHELDQVSAFLAVLFLAARGDVDLEQEKFYGAIELHRPPPERKATKVVPRERFVPRKRTPRKKKATEAEAGEAQVAENHGAEPLEIVQGREAAPEEILTIRPQEEPAA